MRFKKKEIGEQFKQAPLKLQDIARYLDQYAIEHYSKDIIITRIFDKVQTPESGVHAAHRAFDVRVEVATLDQGSVWYFTREEAQALTDLVNVSFPRHDGKATALFHAVLGSTWHIHVQIPYAWLSDKEKEDLRVLS